MKNILLITVFLCAAFVSNAQFTKGQKMIGGQFGIFSASNELASTANANSSAFSLNFSPSVSRFRTPTLLAGTGLYYAYSRYRNYSGNPATERIDPTHIVGGYFNWTKLAPLAKKFYFTYTGTVGVNSSTSRPYFVASGGFDAQRESYGAYVSGGIGLLYQLSERFLLTCELGNIFNISYYHSVQTSYATPTTTFKDISNRRTSPLTWWVLI